MTENLDAAMSSLSEQNKKLDIAMHYTHGDADKAKEMVSGHYKDVFVLKVKFTSTTSSGAFLFFWLRTLIGSHSPLDEERTIFPASIPAMPQGNRPCAALGHASHSRVSRSVIILAPGEKPRV